MRWLPACGLWDGMCSGKRARTTCPPSRPCTLPARYPPYWTTWRACTRDCLRTMRPGRRLHSWRGRAPGSNCPVGTVCGLRRLTLTLMNPSGKSFCCLKVIWCGARTGRTPVMPPRPCRPTPALASPWYVSCQRRKKAGVGTGARHALHLRKRPRRCGLRAGGGAGAR